MSTKKEIIDNRKFDHSERDVVERFAEGREYDERKFHERSIMNMACSDPLYVDPDTIPDGLEYRWMRRAIRNEPDDKRITEIRRKGWTPVPSSRHPEMSFADFFGRGEHVKSYIEHVGLVLCQRAKELCNMETMRVEEENYQRVTTMPATSNFMGEPTIPVRNHSNVYTSKIVKR